jgi:hypothetical protein
MKSTFSRQVSTTVLILLLALLLLGGAFRVLVGRYLEHNTHNQLQTDARLWRSWWRPTMPPVICSTRICGPI